MDALDGQVIDLELEGGENYLKEIWLRSYKHCYGRGEHYNSLWRYG
jgi:hypothetical protein